MCVKCVLNHSELMGRRRGRGRSRAPRRRNPRHVVSSLFDDSQGDNYEVQLAWVHLWNKLSFCPLHVGITPSVLQSNSYIGFPAFFLHWFISCIPSNPIVLIIWVLVHVCMLCFDLSGSTGLWGGPGCCCGQENPEWKRDWEAAYENLRPST